MSDTPIFDAVAKDRPFPSQPPVLELNHKYWARRKKKARALTDRVWREIDQQWKTKTKA